VVHRESDSTYGVPRITAELRAAGDVVNQKAIARVMRGIGLAGVRCAAGTSHQQPGSTPAAST
jgi:helix-turn-helix protein